MAKNPRFNNSGMFTDTSEDYSEITPDNKSEVLATQGNVINSIKTFWNKLRTKLAYAISRPDYSEQVGGNYVPIFVDADGVVRECQPTTIQANIAQNGIIIIPTKDIPNNIYTGTTVCISVLNNSASGSTNDLQIQHNSSTSPVKYPSGVAVQANDISQGDLLLATFCKNSNSSSNNFWILLNKINTVVSTTEKGGHPGLMTAEDKEKLETIERDANNYSLPKATSDILGGVKLGYTTNGINRNYGLQTDTNGNGYVNVPWTVYSLPTANKDTLGGVKSSNTGTEPDRDYNVQVNSDGTMKVNVPWTDTTYTLLTASSSTLGGVKLGADRLATLETPNSTSNADRYYPIQTDKNDKLVVNVPWTDNHNIAYLCAGNNNSTNNEATSNGNTYLKIVDGGSKTSLKISGSKGTKVKSDADGNITIESPYVSSYTSLSRTNNSSAGNYTINGPGIDKANTDYYLAGNGTWQQGILVPIPTKDGKTLKSHADGTVSWE